MEYYRKEFIGAWKQSHSRLPIDVWAKAIGSKMPAFSHPEDIYAPIELDVKIAGGINDSSGNVKLSVSTTDREWYPKFIQGLEQMTGKDNLSVLDYLGNSIEHMTPKDLFYVGELDVFTNEKLLRLPSVVPPPIGMSTDKHITLKKWWENTRDGVSTVIAQNLKGQSLAEIASKTSENGPVQKSIEKYLKSHTLNEMPWDEFIATYGMDNVAKSMDPDETCSFISKGLLHTFREGLRANESQIRTYHATAGIGSEASLWKSSAKESTRYQDDHTMYRDIADDALYRPIIGSHVIDTILNGYQRIDIVPTVRKRVAPANFATVHPISSYYSDIYYPANGKLPGHVMERYNKNQTQPKDYPGNISAAYNVFNMLTGKSILPTETLSTKKMPPLVPIGSKMPSASKMPPLVPIGSKMPPLVPIGSKLPPLVPIGSKTNLNEPLWIDDMPNLEDFL